MKNNNNTKNSHVFFNKHKSVNTLGEASSNYLPVMEAYALISDSFGQKMSATFTFPTFDQPPHSPWSSILMGA